MLSKCVQNCFTALRGFPRDLSSAVGDLQVCRVLCADPNPGPDLAHRPRKQRRRLNRQNRVRKNSRLSSSGLSQNGQDGWKVSGKKSKICRGTISYRRIRDRYLFMTAHSLRVYISGVTKCVTKFLTLTLFIFLAQFFVEPKFFRRDEKFVEDFGPDKNFLASTKNF